MFRNGRRCKKSFVGSLEAGGEALAGVSEVDAEHLLHAPAIASKIRQTAGE